MKLQKDQIITLKQGVDVILDVFGGKDGNYLVINKSKHYGIRIDWQDTSTGYFVMRPNEKSMYPNYIKIFVEDGKRYYRHDHESVSNDKLISDIDHMPDDLAIMFIKDMLDHSKVLGWMMQNNSFEIMARIGYYDIELPECDGYKIYIRQGKVYQNFNVINVEQG